MSKMAAAAGPSADPPPEIVIGSRPSDSPATKTVAVPPICAAGPDGAVVDADMLAIPPVMTCSLLATDFTVVAVVDFFAVVVLVAAFAVDTVAPPDAAVVDVAPATAEVSPVVVTDVEVLASAAVVGTATTWCAPLAPL